MEENCAEAGVMSSVVMLSPAFRLILQQSCSAGGSGMGRGLMLGPRTISTFSASSWGRGGRIMESSMG